MMRQLKATRPPEVTVRLAFAPAEAGQVDFGADPVLMRTRMAARGAPGLS